MDGWDARWNFFLPLCMSSCLSVCLSVCLSSLAKSGPHAAHIQIRARRASQKQPGSQPARYPLGRAKAKTPPTQPNTRINEMKEGNKPLLPRSVSQPVSQPSAPAPARTRKGATYVRNHKQLKSGQPQCRCVEGRPVSQSVTWVDGCHACLHKCQGVRHTDRQTYTRSTVIDIQKLSSER